MPGNPVRVRDGCATVTGYELPMPLTKSREGGSKASPKSGYRLTHARRGCCRSSARSKEHATTSTADFSVKEKDEARPAELSSAGFVECLHSPDCSGSSFRFVLLLVLVLRRALCALITTTRRRTRMIS